MKKIVAGVVAGMLVGGLAACTSEEVAEPSPTVTEIDYGKQYLAIVCPSNIVKDKRQAVANKVYGSDNYLYDYEKVPAALYKANKNTVKATKKMAQQLDDAEWPKEIQKSIDVIAAYGYSVLGWYDKRSKKNSKPSEWPDYEDYVNKKTQQKHSDAVSDVRLTLDLPPGGKGCRAYKKK